MGEYMKTAGMTHIHIAQLKPGMQVVHPGLDWLEYPYLYMADEFIDSPEAVKRIVDEGYQELYVDPARSTCAVEPAAIDTLDVAEKRQLTVPQSAKVALEEELQAAAKIHDEGVAYARKFMRDARAGKVNMESADESMTQIMDSLERNADALLSLSRLRRTDSYTFTHCVNVCVLTALLSRFAGDDEETVFDAGQAGMFHDLGKALVAPQILNAPRKLTRAELEVMRTHPTLGYNQLAAVPGISTAVLYGAAQHHEKHDGTGYPAGLAGDAVSPIGRMVAIADIYDALTSKRAYKEGMFPHRALGIMYEMRDKDLHHDTLAAFIRMMGIYPVGSIVELDDGCVGVVSASNPASPGKPAVTLVRDCDGFEMPPEVIDLDRAGAPAVTRCLDGKCRGIDPAAILGLDRFGSTV